MKESTPEPRTAVMTLVDVSWQDQAGTLIKTRVRMENRSKSGACIRIQQPLEPGTRLRIHWRFDQFFGVVKYCKHEAEGYRVGIQRDPTPAAVEPWLTQENVAPKPEAPGRVDVGVREVLRRQEPQLPMLPLPFGRSANAEERAEKVPSRMPPEAPIELRSEATATRLEQLREPASPVAETELPHQTQFPASQLSSGKEAREERKTMGSKLLQLAHWKKKEEAAHANGNASENTAENGAKSAPQTGPAKNGAHAAVASALAEKSAAERSNTPSDSFQVELLPMEDIYRTAGIVNPRRGYSVTKVVEMLHSEHLKGVSKELKRASVLMALDAAGVSIDEVLKDAKLRQEAIDAYEAEQRKQFEALWAKKAEENLQINAELERVKASYAERIKRNQDGVAREKSTFVNWLTTKQQESQSIDEAVELCTKPVESEPAGAASSSPKIVGVNAKAV